MSRKVRLVIFGMLFLTVAANAIYFIYVFSSYKRIVDNVELDVKGISSDSFVNPGHTYTIASANIGFGAYSDDFSFFMDGGKRGRAVSKNAVVENVSGSARTVASLGADFMFFQEVDYYGTRSHFVDEVRIIENVVEDVASESFNSVYAVNYDSPYIFYPIHEPHGKNKSGILSLSKYNITYAVRKSLPVETGVYKVLDLDRCYSKIYFNVSNGKNLVLYNVHLSAYTKDERIGRNQIVMLINDMKSDYLEGNYVVAGGDFNKELIPNASELFGFVPNGENWSKPFPVDVIDFHFRLVPPEYNEERIPTVRDTSAPYGKNTYVSILDGFIVSDNVTVVSSKAIDSKFKYSDHNPVKMEFVLNP